MSHHINDFVIDKIQSIELREVCGGLEDKVLATWEVSPSAGASYHLAPNTGSGVREPKPRRVYFKCAYCNTIYNIFYSNCPNCGAPIDLINGEIVRDPQM